jgi:hypothetical protein
MATYDLRREGGVVGKTSGGGGLPLPAEGSGLTIGGLGTRRGCDVHRVVDPAAPKTGKMAGSGGERRDPLAMA